MGKGWHMPSVLVTRPPWIMRGVGVPGRATVIDGVGAQFEVPGIVEEDLAQSVPGATFGQPRRGIDGRDVDRVPGQVRRRVGGGHPSGSLLFRAVRGDRLTKQFILVLRGTPAASDGERDTVLSGAAWDLTPTPHRSKRGGISALARPEPGRTMRSLLPTRRDRGTRGRSARRRRRSAPSAPRPCPWSACRGRHRSRPPSSRCGWRRRHRRDHRW
jgi:hypothetical protein